MSQDTWDRRFLEVAAMVAGWSKDPSTQVGCVIVDQGRRILSTGYNGLPRGIVDDPALLEHRETKLRMVIHAEANALLFARRDLSDCTLYVSPMPPCAQCAAKIVQAGIRRIVTRSPTAEQLDRWRTDFLLALLMYTQAGVELVEVA